jgi:sulfur transfer protein SufE
VWASQLVDFAGDPILKAGLVAFLVTLFDEATETVINDVDPQDRLAEVAADGSFTLKLNGADNVIVEPIRFGLSDASP